MTTHPVFHNPEFDAYAADYDAALAQGLAVSGEDKMYFARGRLAWLAACLRQLGEQPATVMDYGCGIGSATPSLFALLGVTCGARHGYFAPVVGGGAAYLWLHAGAFSPV